MNAQERLVIYANAVNLYSAMPSDERASMLLKALMDLFPSTKRTPVTLESEHWPLPLQCLVPLAVKWAIEDDVEREQILERASAQELGALIDQVRPQLALIGSYLDDESKLPGVIASRLHALVQAALEAERLGTP